VWRRYCDDVGRVTCRWWRLCYPLCSLQYPPRPYIYMNSLWIHQYNDIVEYSIKNRFSVCSQCILIVFSMYSQCILNVFSMYSQCILSVFSMYYQCIINVLSNTCILNVFWMYFSSTYYYSVWVEVTIIVWHRYYYQNIQNSLN